MGNRLDDGTDYLWSATVCCLASVVLERDESPLEAVGWVLRRFGLAQGGL